MCIEKLKKSRNCEQKEENRTFKLSNYGLWRISIQLTSFMRKIKVAYPQT